MSQTRNATQTNDGQREKGSNDHCGRKKPSKIKEPINISWNRICMYILYIWRCSHNQTLTIYIRAIYIYGICTVYPHITHNGGVSEWSKSFCLRNRSGKKFSFSSFVFDIRSREFCTNVYSMPKWSHSFSDWPFHFLKLLARCRGDYATTALYNLIRSSCHLLSFASGQQIYKRQR